MVFFQVYDTKLEGSRKFIAIRETPLARLIYVAGDNMRRSKHLLIVFRKRGFSIY